MKEKKQVLLRIPNELWENLNQIADEECRSVNSQIEYILTKEVRNKRTKEKVLIEKLVTDLAESDATIVINNYRKYMR